MSLRWRVSLVLGGISLVAMLAVSAASYVATARELDEAASTLLNERIAVLRAQPNLIVDRSGRRREGAVREIERLEVEIQVVRPNGTVIRLGQAELPVGDEVLRLLRAGQGSIEYESEVDGRTYLVRAEASPTSVAMVAIDRTADTEVLRALRNRMIVIAAIATAGAAAVGFVLARRITQPIERLTTATGRVAASNDLTPVPVEGDAEVGRLAASFNQMLAALRSSKDQQRRLVEDASHELRTPLTSVRTNVELLRSASSLSDDDRQAILDDLHTELVELSEMVTELVDLARDVQVDEEPATDLRFDELVREVAERVARRTGRPVSITTAPVTVHAPRSGLERAVSNVLHNAVKFSPDSSAVEVVQTGGRFTVRDHGPGIAPVDRDRVFDRFFRAEATRSAPGSGLGLAIVADVVAAAGGRTIVDTPPDGGAIVGFELPTVPDATLPG